MLKACQKAKDKLAKILLDRCNEEQERTEYFEIIGEFICPLCGGDLETETKTIDGGAADCITHRLVCPKCKKFKDPFSD